MTPAPSPAETLETAADFVLEVLAASSRAPFGQLTWVEINRLSARWLRPGPSGDTSQTGHRVVMEMAHHGLLDAEMTTAADGSRMVARVAHPSYWGACAGRALAA